MKDPHGGWESEQQAHLCGEKQQSAEEREVILSKDPTPTWNASFHQLVTNPAWECSLTKEQNLIRGMMTPEPEVQSHRDSSRSARDLPGRGLSPGNGKILAVMLLLLLGGTC